MYSNIMKKLIRLLSLCMFFAFPIYGEAAVVTIDGDDVSFTYDDATLFGPANIIGNSIFFLPTTFKAESLNGIGAVTENQTLNITIEAITAGYAIDSFLLQESGDYKLNGSGASSNVNGMLAVTSLTKTTGVTFPMPFREEQFFDTGALADTAGAPASWSTGAGIDLGTITGWEQDTKVTVTIENLLTATTLNNGEQAFVEKKFGGVGLSINPIPVPAAVWLFGSGLIGLVGVARRRKL